MNDDQLLGWLALREPADTRARAASVAQAVIAALPAASPLRCLDLASGTGSNVRYLTPRLPQPHEWLAVDRDADLLAQQPPGVSTRAIELGTLDPRIFEGRHLVTASALLDLVSERWIADLAACCRSAGTAILFPLNYDGRSSCDPAEPEDDDVRRLFNAHQRANDKGFGRAAGPDATACAMRAFTDAGYHVVHASSDWVLRPDEVAMQRVLALGWATAASEMEEKTGWIEQWLTRRLSHIEAGRSRIVVSHQDVGGWIAL